MQYIGKFNIYNFYTQSGRQKPKPPQPQVLSVNLLGGIGTEGPMLIVATIRKLANPPPLS